MTVAADHQAMPDEQVLCVSRHLLFSDGAWHGLITTGLSRVLRIIRDAADWRPRRYVEDDWEQQQIIPYCVVRHRDGSHLLTRRLRRSTEVRLHDLHSLGVGGHVNPEDAGDHGPIVGGLAREWQEEVICPSTASAQLVGILNDDTTPVSRVHLGLVFLVEPHGHEHVRVRETHKLAGATMTLEELMLHRESMETWSQLILEGLRRGDLDPTTRSPLAVELPAAP